MVWMLEVITVVLVALAMALSVAHALELPGKLRLDEKTYGAVQEIYYPGFTAGGFAEPAALAALLALLIAHWSAQSFWWFFVAFVFLLAAHLTYWLVTHPVNNFWTKDVKLSGAAAKFFGSFRRDVGSDWSKLRDTWEYSHVVRAVLSVVALVSLTIAVSAAEASAYRGS